MEASLAEMLPPEIADLEEIADPWGWAWRNHVKLVGAVFQHEGHEFQVEPMRATTKTVTVRTTWSPPLRGD
jgi:hypothetical protein